MNNAKSKSALSIYIPMPLTEDRKIWISIYIITNNIPFKIILTNISKYKINEK